MGVVLCLVWQSCTATAPAPLTACSCSSVPHKPDLGTYQGTYLGTCLTWAGVQNIINGVLGAFTTSFETFVIPTLAFNWTYMFSTNRETCPKQPWT